MRSQQVPIAPSADLLDGLTAVFGIPHVPPARPDSAVNYTTLGYGDIVMSPRWRLLGPQEAVSGTLAFGWSTAAIVTVVIRLVRHRQRAQARSKRHAA